MDTSNRIIAGVPASEEMSAFWKKGYSNSLNASNRDGQQQVARDDEGQEKHV
jgi:hypothetical protein